MISRTLQVAVLLAVLVYFVILFSFLKKKKLNLKYTLLWIISGVLMLVIALFPGILTALAHLVGIHLPVNALFALGFFCVILILMSQTVIISKQNEQIKRLTQQLALLDKRVRDTEKQHEESIR